MKFKTKPYAHQLDCLKKFWKYEAYALLAEMGTGKTWIMINNAARLWEEDICDAMLVFAPNGVQTNWTRLEIPAHMPESVKYHSAAWIAGANKKELADIERLYTVSSEMLRIFSMNWEALQNKRGMEAALRFAESAENLMIVCDESDAIKNPSAKRTRNLMYLRSFSTYRRIMCGTPINNAPFDLFSQFRFLHSKIIGTTSFCTFKARYAKMIHKGPLYDYIKARSKRGGNIQVIAKDSRGLPQYCNLNDLSRRIAPYSFRILKDECLDLPDKIYKTVLFTLTPKQRAVYTKAEKECRLVFEETEMPFDRLVAMVKLSQITSGYFVHPAADKPVRIDGENPKLKLLIERVQSIIRAGNKIIVWARYRIEIEDIASAFKEAGINFVEYHGGTTKKKRIEAIDSINDKDSPVSVFIGQQQAGGRGLTLIGASYVIYYSNSYSYRDRAQSEDRTHRIGQRRNVTYLNFAAQDTVDEQVIFALAHKKDVAEIIVDKGLELFQ